MFGALKNKLSSFVKRVSGREKNLDESIKEGMVEDAKKLVPPAPKNAPQQPEPKPVPEVKPIESFKSPEQSEPEVKKEEPAIGEKKESEPKPVPKPLAEKNFADEVVAEQINEHVPKPEFETEFDKQPEVKKAPIAPKPVKKTETRKPVFEVKEKEQKELNPKIGLLKKVSGIFSGSITISEEETNELFEELEISLLESDVSFDTAQFLVDDLRKRLIGKKVARNSVSESISGEVRNALLDLLSVPSYDFFERVNEKKPFTILFFGPNGSGKTTTIAKLAYHLSKRGKKSVIAASDTFRAAAIHQAVEHGEKLGVKVIKQDYGADPSAVAFDAIEHAKAKGLDVILVDTAGRQETNKNLIREMEKMNRVIKPDLKLFVGEATSGHALVEQAQKLSEAVGGLDGVILTKLDCDAKGGNTFSIAHELKSPILFLGVGQDYEDLKPFDAEWLVSNIVPAS